MDEASNAERAFPKSSESASDSSSAGPKDRGCGSRARGKRKKSWIERRAWFLALVAVLVVYLSVSGCSERMFFYPSGGGFETPAGIEDVWFENAAGQRLHGWFLPPKGDVPEPWPAVLHVHGNAGNITHHEPFCSWLTERGYAVMLFDYRSYGKSDSGSLDREAVLADAHAALDALLARDDVDPARVGVFGFSLGGATATRLMAQREEPRLLVAAAPFSGWQRVAGDYTPLVNKLFIRDYGNPEDAITLIGPRPVLLVHGLDDLTVRPYHTVRLLDAGRGAGVPAQREVFEGLNHNDLLMDTRVRATIGAFIDASMQAGPSVP